MREDIKIQNTKYKMQDFKRFKRLLGKKVKDVKDYDGIKLILEDDSWLLLRRSGTEPLVRIYSEAESKREAERLISLGKRWISP